MAVPQNPADIQPRQVANKSDNITLELTKEQVTAAPEYKEDTPIVVLGAAGSLRPLSIP